MRGGGAIGDGGGREGRAGGWGGGTVWRGGNAVVALGMLVGWGMGCLGGRGVLRIGRFDRTALRVGVVSRNSLWGSEEGMAERLGRDDEFYAHTYVE